jgi:hypothetical protein
MDFIKKYGGFAISVNIAIVLANELVGGVVVIVLYPVMISILGPMIESGTLLDALMLSFIAGIIASIIIVFLSTLWMFKMTFFNSKKSGRGIELQPAMFTTTGLFLIFNLVYKIATIKDVDISTLVIGIVVLSLFVLLGCYLGGRMAIKKFAKLPQSTENKEAEQSRP